MKRDKKKEDNNEDVCCEIDKCEIDKLDFENDSDADKHYVRCLKCGQILRCSRFNSGVLLDHIRREHPEIEVVDNRPPTETATSNECASQHSLKCNKDAKCRSAEPACPNTGCGNTAKKNECGKPKPSAEELTKTARFRSSIENWRPMDGCLYCPCCECTKPPCVKTRNELFSNNALGSVCILSCWPLCFLPFCVNDDKKYLHCSNCNTFLGLYDRNCNAVRPNKKFIPDPCNSNPCDTCPKSSCPN